MNKINNNVSVSKSEKSMPFMMRFLEEIPEVKSNFGDPPTYAGTTNPTANPPQEDVGRD